MASGLSLDVKMLGMDGLASGLDTGMAGILAKVNASIQAAGLTCEATAKQLCPVDTGRLRSSIQYMSGPFGCTIGTSTFYAPFVELGHHSRSGSWVAAQPFMMPGYTAAKNQLVSDLRKLGKVTLSTIS